MEHTSTVKIIDDVLKGIYNLGYDQFKDILATEVRYISDEGYQRHFDQMRSDLFHWWCSVSENVKIAFVKALANR